jgi:uncharacterized membrane protein YfcA
MGGLLEGWQTWGFILAGSLIGGFVNGLTGFGTGMTALPLWLQVLEPVLAAQLVSAASVGGHVYTLPTLWRAFNWRRMAPMTIAGLIGVPIGVWLLSRISLGAFKLTVGLLLVGYCAFMLFAAGRVRVAGGGAKAEAAIGIGGGVLGGIAGLSGVLPIVWATLKGWSKEQRRVSLQVFNMIVLTATLVVSLMRGLIGMSLLATFAVALPGTFLGARLGVMLYRRVDDMSFERIVLALLLISGIGLVWSAR